MRTLVAPKNFQKKLSSFLKKHPDLKTKTLNVLSQIEADLFAATLDTHKLSGKLKLFYACSISYDYRIVFYFDEQVVYLLNIGSHDEVYG